MLMQLISPTKQKTTFSVQNELICLDLDVWFSQIVSLLPYRLRMSAALPSINSRTLADRSPSLCLSHILELLVALASCINAGGKNSVVHDLRFIPLQWPVNTTHGPDNNCAASGSRNASPATTQIPTQ